VLRVWAVTALFTAILAACAGWCAVAAHHNLQGFLRTRRRAPLEAEEVMLAVTTGNVLPASWPSPTGLTDARLASAYRDYAQERRDSLVLAGELIAIIGGAALGASVPTALQGGWHAWPAATAALVATLGLALKHRGHNRWGEVRRLYERRRSEVSTPSGAFEDPPRGWLRRWLN
jgi:hypothetical protein